jgi:ABC-type multidrug transport system ATPase subunit
MNDGRVSAAVRLEGVAKVYGTFAALRSVTTEFAPGSSTVNLGENGAGKSTLLRVIAGLSAPTRGQVEVFGRLPQTQRRRIAYMSHETMLYDELSALENLRYFARLHDAHTCTSGACAASPEVALRSVGLDPALSRPVGQYSQGMRQRASLARVLQVDPELLLLDEPFSNMDVESARQMVTLLLEFRTWPVESSPDEQRGGRTVILTTHQFGLAEPLAQRTIKMRAGRIESDQTVSSTLPQPTPQVVQ